MKQYILPFIIIVLALLVIVSIAAARTATHKAEAADARAEAAKQAEAQAQADLAACLERERQAVKARTIDAQTTRYMEIKQDEAQAKFNEIRSDSCHIDDDARLDQRVRELAIEAYRVAICTEPAAAYDPSVPATTRPGTP
jgi:biopolymer transport protein ExbD